MSNKNQENPFDGDIFHGHLHVISLCITCDGDDALEWTDTDIRSEHEDASEALQAYLSEEFGEEVPQVEQDGAIRVDDPLFAAGECIRLYKV